ncbi:hypothetical protein C0995_003505 [Termitomyces sp. Mi166|nr:hypothetical protein C0995_003505 [Termitomyces sp. Mi166\
MEAFNIAVGVSNIVNCVTGACTLGMYQKNERCKINIHLDASKEHTMIAFKDLAKYASVLDRNEYSELEKDCQDISDQVRTSVAAVPKESFFVRRTKYKKLLEKAQTLEENTYNVILKIRGQSAAAIAREAERQRVVQRRNAVQTTQSVNDQEQDSNHHNPFSDEATAAWQDPKHNA